MSPLPNKDPNQPYYPQNIVNGGLQPQADLMGGEGVASMALLPDFDQMTMDRTTDIQKQAMHGDDYFKNQLMGQTEKVSNGPVDNGTQGGMLYGPKDYQNAIQARLMKGSDVYHNNMQRRAEAEAPMAHFKALGRSDRLSQQAYNAADAKAKVAQAQLDSMMSEYFQREAARNSVISGIITGVFTAAGVVIGAYAGNPVAGGVAGAAAGKAVGGAVAPS